MNTNLSIVMPTYNRAGSFLKEAVQSILNQSYRDFELIIIDDASSDNTQDLIQSLNDKRIYYEKTEHNHGEYWAINYGVNIAKGKYLAWVHSDDTLPQDSLQIRVNELENNQSIDFIHGDIVKIDEKGNVITRIDAVDLDSEMLISQYTQPENTRTAKYLMHHTTIMMKWKFFYQAGPFDCSLPFAGDIDWLIRAIHAGKFHYIHKVLYNYRTHPGTRRILDIKNGINKDKISEMIIRRYT
jgi:glycosyltransferase involved in cell wall biosynthesis